MKTSKKATMNSPTRAFLVVFVRTNFVMANSELTASDPLLLENRDHDVHADPSLFATTVRRKRTHEHQKSLSAEAHPLLYPRGRLVQNKDLPAAGVFALGCRPVQARPMSSTAENHTTRPEEIKENTKDGEKDEGKHKLEEVRNARMYVPSQEEPQEPPHPPSHPGGAQNTLPSRPAPKSTPRHVQPATQKKKDSCAPCVYEVTEGTYRTERGTNGGGKGARRPTTSLKETAAKPRAQEPVTHSACTCRTC